MGEWRRIGGIDNGVGMEPVFSNTPLSANGKYEIIQPSQLPSLSVTRREANIRRFANLKDWTNVHDGGISERLSLKADEGRQGQDP